MTNQDGLGTDSFPEDTWPAKFYFKGFRKWYSFDDIFVDRSFLKIMPNVSQEQGMLMKYIDNPAYDLANSFVLGDRLTDVEC
jgi:imidazoleglycerol-phosphate dehydratase/histidinol-phosphatase